MSQTGTAASFEGEKEEKENFSSSTGGTGDHNHKSDCPRITDHGCDGKTEFPFFTEKDSCDFPAFKELNSMKSPAWKAMKGRRLTGVWQEEFVPVWHHRP